MSINYDYYIIIIIVSSIVCFPFEFNLPRIHSNLDMPTVGMGHIRDKMNAIRSNKITGVIAVAFNAK